MNENRTIKNTAAWTSDELKAGFSRQIASIANATAASQVLGMVIGPALAKSEGRNPVITVAALSQDSIARLNLIIAEMKKRPELAAYVKAEGLDDREAIASLVTAKVEALMEAASFKFSKGGA